MEHSEGKIQGAGGLELYVQSWRPDTDPIATLAFFHGLGEHCGRYQTLVDTLVARGYALYGFAKRASVAAEAVCDEPFVPSLVIPRAPLGVHGSPSLLQQNRLEDVCPQHTRQRLSPIAFYPVADNSACRLRLLGAISRTVAPAFWSASSAMRIVSKGGTAFPMSRAQAVRLFVDPKSKKSGKVCTRAASCGVITRRLEGWT